MNKVSLFVKPVIISLFFVVVVSPAFAVSPNGRGKPVANVTSRMIRACQDKETSVKTRMTQLSRLVVTMEETFDKIAARVETYYSDTVLPSGKSVSNYSALVAEIATKKDMVQTEVTKAQADIANFSCTSGDPKTLMNQFRINMQSVKTALKNYRTSIRNLIVAVRTVSEGLDATTTPTPSI